MAALGALDVLSLGALGVSTVFAEPSLPPPLLGAAALTALGLAIAALVLLDGCCCNQLRSTKDLGPWYSYPSPYPSQLPHRSSPPRYGAASPRRIGVSESPYNHSGASSLHRCGTSTFTPSPSRSSPTKLVLL